MGNPDQPTPEHIVKKLVETVQRGDTHRYSQSKGIPRLRRAICDWYKKKFNVDKETIVADIGCAEANFSLDVIDKVKHIYLLETNNVWSEPLKATFGTYKEKVTIVNKKFYNKTFRLQ